MRESATHRPLADLLRPQKLQDVIGQTPLLGEKGALRAVLTAQRVSSMIFQGPPGSGKTTIARLLADEIGWRFVETSAVMTGIAAFKKIFDAAREERAGTLLFVDEIHRLNRAQQDCFLPVIEDGTITLIGATTENPSFSLNGALLSRARVLVFQRLDFEVLAALLERAERFLGRALPLRDAQAREALAALADGDGRALLNLVEALCAHAQEQETFSAEELGDFLQKRAPDYDRDQDHHYNLISALHKSIRGSDPDAALYYFCRMAEAGEDMAFIARRCVRMASEDVGNADPGALTIALNAREAYAFLGSPEGELALAQAVLYLATAPKSNAIYAADKKARACVRATGSLTPPKTILNAPTALMKTQGYGDGYLYDHDAPDAFSGQNYWPEELERRTFYHPVARGFERKIQERLAWWDGRRKEKKWNA